ncbi:MAG: DUF488 family protein [Thermodesulfobacteriota bacterium]
MIYTIGYQNITADQLIDHLRQNAVDVLIDVRSKPFSRKKAFNKRALEKRLSDAGIAYRWWGDKLGGFSTIHETAIRSLAAFASDKTVCLMCMEADPDQCHRKNEIARRLAGQDVIARHILT